MRYLHSTGGVAIADTEETWAFTNNVAGEPVAGPGPNEDEFLADFVEVTNGGAEVLLANPYGSMDDGRGGVVIPAGKTMRFEWAAENAQARDKGGFPGIWLISTAAGTTVYVLAGAE